MMKKINKLVTHNGSFHADDIFACATLCLFLEKNNEEFEVIRTRDAEIINAGDYVFDVGEVYDEKINRFDHHQKIKAGDRANGLPYAAFGLVWKKLGLDLTGNKEIVDLVDKNLVSPIDAHDNGFALVEKKYDIFPYLIQDVFDSMCPTWTENNLNIDEIFLENVLLAKKILQREIIRARDIILADKLIVSIYKNTQDKRLIVLEEHYPFEYSLNKLPEPLFVVYPTKASNTWAVKAIRKSFGNFSNRKDLPSSWGGLREDDLRKITGVSDAVFCHRALFLVVAKSKEGAIALAQKALSE